MTGTLSTGIADEILAKTRRAMDELGLDVVVATSPENVAYASGAAPPMASSKSNRTGPVSVCSSSRPIRSA